MQATDLDSTDNIQYQFAGGDSSAFSINTLNGLIQTSQALDYNIKNQYVFTVTTSDGAGGTVLSASATVTVIVNVSDPLSLVSLLALHYLTCHPSVFIPVPLYALLPPIPHFCIVGSLKAVLCFIEYDKRKQ